MKEKINESFVFNIFISERELVTGNYFPLDLMVNDLEID